MAPKMVATVPIRLMLQVLVVAVVMLMMMVSIVYHHGMVNRSERLMVVVVVVMMEAALSQCKGKKTKPVIASVFWDKIG